jgi:anaerobic ribonucleoside-triphosphate reductase activating protein
MWHILDLLKPRWISGLSLLGGEPLAPANIRTVLELVRKVKAIFPTKTIWCYTGYTWEDVKDHKIMKYMDVVVDGRFIEAERDISLQFRGSRNQRIIDVKKSLASGEVVLWEGE